MKTKTSSRKFLTLTFIVLALAALAVGLTGCSSDDGFSVGQVQGDPFAFAGEITINGTVAAFSDDPNLFGVMDTDELMQCGRFDCGAWKMPTLYTGPQIPAISQGDNVVMTGEFTRMDDMVVFQVNSMDVGNNIMNRLP